jgi:hypothetical protein
MGCLAGVSGSRAKPLLSRGTPCPNSRVGRRQRSVCRCEPNGQCYDRSWRSAGFERVFVLKRSLWRWRRMRSTTRGSVIKVTRRMRAPQAPQVRGSVSKDVVSYYTSRSICVAGFLVRGLIHDPAGFLPRVHLTIGCIIHPLLMGRYSGTPGGCPSCAISSRVLHTRSRGSRKSRRSLMQRQRSGDDLVWESACRLLRPGD